jgi:hypothetical protein
MTFFLPELGTAQPVHRAAHMQASTNMDHDRQRLRLANSSFVVLPNPAASRLTEMLVHRLRNHCRAHCTVALLMQQMRLHGIIQGRRPGRVA